jgi:serine/threonine protein kinase
MYQIFDALSYLDKLNIVHRDIKAENIVYDEKTEIIKIVDFG